MTLRKEDVSIELDGRTLLTSSAFDMDERQPSGRRCVGAPKANRTSVNSLATGSPFIQPVGAASYSSAQAAASSSSEKPVDSLFKGGAASTQTHCPLCNKDLRKVIDSQKVGLFLPIDLVSAGHHHQKAETSIPSTD